MNRRARRSLATAATLLALLVPSQAGAQGQKEWTWKDRNGKTRTRAELEKILGEHELWLESRESQGSRADLRGAELDYAQLARVNLAQASLSKTRLISANLNDAFLNGAEMDGAFLGSAQLENADLNGAHLENANMYDALLKNTILDFAHMTNAKLYDAVLTGAGLKGADLTGANLFRANVNGAYLIYTELKDAYFSAADLQNAIFEPNSIPDVRGVARAKNLEFLTYEQNPDALVQLRKQFQENGFRTQERKITYALRRRKAELDGPVERWFYRIAFDLTCQYGMNPGRALKIWLALLLFFWLIYAVFIHVPGESGIYQLREARGPAAKEEIEEQIRPRTIPALPLSQYPLRLIYRELRVFFWAGSFSLMSAFNIGFRDINFGRWLRLLPRTEYDLTAKGWARMVARFQSLISVYLIALWVLTYFGRPFE